ncbi:hypothetical protein [Thalassotalea sp. PS06]|uniref:hypothetical protein n=1 Tax=Thalassotalea sp. PS06 TaxID=2594005 RepID=UPI001164028F|nr:hypothetical protein [Thalassotalea sp. PS06]QDP02136.1 hypothetical protein FNC98_12775 [Thalassotalea sp. PS06]
MISCLVTDIFGRTDAMEELAAELSADSNTDSGSLAEWRILDPYQGVRHDFTDEASAYGYFQQHMGLTNYESLIAEELNNTQYSLAIGFSVGASALWQYLSQSKSMSIQQAVLFYGSQIRNMPLNSPQVPTHIIQPKSEPHFDVNKLSIKLTQLENVSIERTKYLHGFMNRKSDNFNVEGYQRYLARLKGTQPLG